MLSFNVCLLLLLNVIIISSALEPITTASGLGAVFVGLGVAYNYAKCFKDECCDERWIKFDAEGLNSDFREKVFGQHLVQRLVMRSLKSHLRKRPRKGLVMSFHGLTGSGKNLVSTLIAKNLLYLGAKSKFYKLYIGSKDFPHKEEVNKYRQKLRTEIEQATALCEQNLFVFDEVDKMQPGVLDAISPYVDYHESLNGVDYRKNIFIFISNAGGKNITKVALNFWAEGKEREEIKIKDIERLVTLESFNEKGGLQHSDIIKKFLIDIHIPFLPLEKKHVRACIFSEVRARNMTIDNQGIDDIMNQIIFYPKDLELFADSGCKMVSSKIGVYFEDDEKEDEDDEKEDEDDF